MVAIHILLSAVIRHLQDDGHNANCLISITQAQIVQFWWNAICKCTVGTRKRPRDQTRNGNWQPGAIWDPVDGRILEIHFRSNPRWPRAYHSARVALVCDPHSHHLCSRFEVDGDMWNQKQWPYASMNAYSVSQKSSPQKLFAIFSLRLSIFPWN